MSGFFSMDGRLKKMKNKKHIKIEATCNQCGKQMEAILELERYAIPVCVNPACPNFALLQISVEKVIEFEEKNNETK